VWADRIAAPALEVPMFMRVLAVATLLCGLAVAAPARADKRYAIEDLEALVKSQSWDEAEQHLGDIPPSKRDARWKAVAEKTAIAQLRELDLEKSPLEAVTVADSYTKRFAALLQSRAFMQVRAELGLKGFETCLEANTVPEECSDHMLPFVEADKGNIDLAIKAAQLRQKHSYSYKTAALWRVAAEWGKGSKKVCTAYPMADAIAAAMGQPSDHEMVKPALRVADICFPYLKARLQQSAGSGEKHVKENICPLLKRKNDVGKAPCGG
jgi:hypothetical protein